jgi:hypothetical protein
MLNAEKICIILRKVCQSVLIADKVIKNLRKCAKSLESIRKRAFSLIFFLTGFSHFSLLQQTSGASQLGQAAITSMFAARRISQSENGKF